MADDTAPTAEETAQTDEETAPTDAESARAPAAAHRPAPDRRLLLAVGAVVLAAVVVLVLLVRGCGDDGGGGPPPGRVAGILPPGTLVALDISTDREREAVGQAADLLARFPSYRPTRDALYRRLAGGAGVDVARDVEPWLGGEAALALLDSQTGTAGSLLALAVDDRGAARRFLRRTAGRPVPTSYRGTAIDNYGDVATAFVGGYLVIGQAAGVRASIAAAGAGASLADGRTYRRATGGLPDDRVAVAYASAAGVRRLLAPQAGLVGLAGVLVDRPGLVGAAAALAPDDAGATVVARSVVNGALAGAAPGKAFEPSLASEVPPDALLFADATGIDRTAGRLLGLANVAGLGNGGLGAALSRAGRDLGLARSAQVAATLLPIARGEVAVWLTPTVPATTLTLLAKVDDEDATSRALRVVQRPLARLLVPRGQTGAAPAFRPAAVAGERAFVLTLGPGAQIAYAVFDGKLVVSTSLAGIRAVKDRDGSLADTETYRRATDGLPSRVTALGFLDFTRLLQLGEQTGLRDNQRYLAIREDLRKVRSVGAATQGEANLATAEFHFEIP